MRMRILGIRGHYCGMRSRVLAVGLAMATLSGCAIPEPYVYRPSEFDRRTFVKSVAAVPGEIQVCYAAKGTTPNEVVRLAQEECAKYSKSAQFIGNEVLNCPLSTPVAARYYCCPSPVLPTIGIRCSATGSHVEWLTADELNEIRRQQRIRPQ